MMDIGGACDRIYGSADVETIDKERLVRALTLTPEQTSLASCEGFSYGQQLEEGLLDAIHLQGFGDLKIPITIEDVGRLKAMSEPAPYGKGLNVSVDLTKKKAQQINASKIMKTSPEDFLSFSLADVSLSTLQSLNLGWLLEGPSPEMVEIHLHKLLIYETGGHYKRQCDSDLEQGLCAVLILQIPVEKGYRGGRVKVEYHSATKQYDLDTDSDTSLYLTAFRSCCEHEMEPIKSGCKVELVIHLVWRNGVEVAKIPLPLPHVLDSLSEIRQSVEVWFTDAEQATKKRLQLRRHSSSLSGTQILNDVATNQSGIYCFESFDNKMENLVWTMLPRGQPCRKGFDIPNQGEVKRKGNQIIAFLLEHDYSPTELSFSKLRGRDLIIARLLSCASFLDVHLAVLKQEVLHKDTDLMLEEQSTNAVRLQNWINSNNILVPFKGLELELCSQVVKDLQSTSKQTPTNQKSETARFDQQAVLVIWPSFQSFHIKCRYAFDIALDEVESQLLRPYFHQSKAIDSLQRILSFCLIEPSAVFFNGSALPGERTGRLLQLCVSLHAKEEGLNLLQILGTDYTSDPPAGQEILFEGIRSDQVADLIAEFECRVSGWLACSSFILKLITPVRLITQLKFIVGLARNLIRRCCIEGAIKVLDRLSLVLPKLDPSTISRLDHEGIESYINFIIDCEEDPKTADGHRVASFARLFPNLDSYLQCRLVVDLRRRIRFGGILSCMALYQDMCRAIPLCDLHESSSIHKIFTQVLSCLFHLGDPELIQQLTNKICLIPSTESHQENILIDVLLSSEEFWELASSDPGNSMMAALVDAQVTSLSAMVNCDNALDLTKKIRLVRNLSELELRLDEKSEAIRDVRKRLITTLVDVFTQLLSRESDSLPSDERSDPLQVNVTLFFKALLQTERACSDRNQNSEAIVSCEVLFSKMSLKRLWHLMLELFRMESTSQTDLKIPPTCLSVYQDLHRRVVSCDIIGFIDSSKRMVVKLTKCLFWLGDEKSLRLFTQKVCGCVSIEEENLFVNIIVGTTSVWPLAIRSPQSLDAFYVLLDHRIDYLKTIVKPVFSFEQPSAQLPLHPEVQTFLRSSEESLTYRNVASIFHARSFAEELTKLCLIEGWGSVKVEAKGTARSAWCEITKTKDFHQMKMAQYHSKQQELSDCVILRENFESRVKESMEKDLKALANSNANSDCIVCPFSPSKLEPEVIEIVD